MFTTGRIIFAISFFVVFVIVMIFAYRKDMQQEKQWYSKPWLVLVGIIVILFLYWVLARI